MQHSQLSISVDSASADFHLWMRNLQIWKADCHADRHWWWRGPGVGAVEVVKYGGVLDLFWKECFPGGTSDKELACQCRRRKRHGFNSWVRKIPWRRAWQPSQDSCLENPMDRGAWQATVHRIAKSRAWLKWLHVQSKHKCRVWDWTCKCGYEMKRCIKMMPRFWPEQLEEGG